MVNRCKPLILLYISKPNELKAQTKECIDAKLPKGETLEERTHTYSYLKDRKITRNGRVFMTDSKIRNPERKKQTDLYLYTTKTLHPIIIFLKVCLRQKKQRLYLSVQFCECLLGHWMIQSSQPFVSSSHCRERERDLQMNDLCLLSIIRSLSCNFPARGICTYQRSPGDKKEDEQPSKNEESDPSSL